MPKPPAGASHIRPLSENKQVENALGAEPSYYVSVIKTNFKNSDDWFVDYKREFEKPTTYEGVGASFKVERVEDVIIDGIKAKKIFYGYTAPFYDTCFAVVKSNYIYKTCYDGGLRNDEYQAAKIGVDEYGVGKFDEKKLESSRLKYRKQLDDISSTFKFTK